MSIDLSRPFMVMRKGKVVTKPYHKKTYIYIEKSNLESQKKLQDALQDEVAKWDNGKYILKASLKGKTYNRGSKIVATFEVEEGKILNLRLV